MGIPHLTTHLRSYADNESLSGQSVVIDGPGLAYHVWHICLSSQPQARNPFEAAPSYRLIGETFIRWLDELRGFDIAVKKIYFDGFLPLSKRDVRSTRLLGYTKQVSSYQEAWPQIIPSMRPDQVVSTALPRFSGAMPVPTGITKLPAAPFLVPAVMEALNASSRYKHITETVPGEADLYCARQLRKYGGIVLTSDSDLLVHDLGSGAVCYLKDIEFPAREEGKALHAPLYRISNILKRLAMEEQHDLRGLAFEMVMDSHGSFRELLQRAVVLKSAKEYESMFQQFSMEYTPLPFPSTQSQYNGGTVMSSALPGQLKRLDPRISELVLQFSPFSTTAGLEKPISPVVITGKKDVDVFLPFLIDCPLKTSAWEMSTSVRQLAYGLLNLVIAPSEKLSTVVEHRRQQSGSRGREWQVPTIEEIPEACTTLSELLDSIFSGVPHLSMVDMWRSVSIYQDVSYAYLNSKPSLAYKLVNHEARKAGSITRTTWDSIHFSAQMQGSFYSFRILKQILAVVVASGPESPHTYVDRLQKCLESLPPLADLPSCEAERRYLYSSESMEAYVHANKLLGIKDMNHEKDSKNLKSSKVDKKKRKRDKSSTALRALEKKPTNIFELLSSD